MIEKKDFGTSKNSRATYQLSPDDQVAETIYKTKTTRLPTGRFMVIIPLQKSCPVLGDSKSGALQRFKALKHRLGQNHSFHRQYIEFMQDYLSSGHMELVPHVNKKIPYHCVIWPDNSTTKLRVVFNTSALTTTGVSFNQCMYTGPKSQSDLQLVLLRARL